MWIGNLIRCYNPRSHRSERVKGFAHQPLRCSSLVVARAYVIHYGVAEYVVAPRLACDMPPASPDHKRKLRFIIGRLRHFWKDNVIARPDHCRGKFVEDRWNIRDLGTCFCRVVAIVQAYADQFPRLGDWRSQAHRGKRNARNFWAIDDLLRLGESLRPRFNKVQQRSVAARGKIDDDIVLHRSGPLTAVLFE